MVRVRWYTKDNVTPGLQLSRQIFNAVWVSYRMVGGVMEMVNMATRSRLNTVSSFFDSPSISGSIDVDVELPVEYSDTLSFFTYMNLIGKYKKDKNVKVCTGKASLDVPINLKKIRMSVSTEKKGVIKFNIGYEAGKFLFNDKIVIVNGYYKEVAEGLYFKILMPPDLKKMSMFVVSKYTGPLTPDNAFTSQ